MILPHCLKNFKYQGECTSSTLYPLPVTDAMPEMSCTLEGSIIYLLRVSIVRITDKLRTNLN